VIDGWLTRERVSRFFKKRGRGSLKHISYIDDLNEWKASFSFFHPIKVRFSETDAFGHLNNTVPFVYFEEARIEFLRHIGLMDRWLSETSEAIPVVADLQCHFLQQVYFAERLQIGVKVHEIGNSSVDLHYIGQKEDGTIAFTGRGIMVQISKQTGKGIPWSDEMRSILKGSSES
jgi:acyl-CoA thioester hydrolase